MTWTHLDKRKPNGRLFCPEPEAKPPWRYATRWFVPDKGGDGWYMRLCGSVWGGYSE